jgi:hypothetical protein
MKAAESIGTALGTVVAKVNAWVAQREELARELREVADRLMAGENPFGERVTTPSMLKKEVEERNTAGRKRRFTMSPEARARIAEAQRRRWAKYKKTKKSSAST